MLTGAHIGDLNVAHDDNWKSADPLAALIDMINEQLADPIDFVSLPGDDADHDEVQQYARIARALKRLKVPYLRIPGEHDFEPCALRAGGRLADFRIVSDTVDASGKWPEGDAVAGTDAWAMPRWREHGLLGTRLGPNKGGRQW